jgi:hypothetical protein
MATQQLTGHTIDLSEEERTALLRLLQEALSEMQAEKRRTEAPYYRDLLVREEARIRGVIEKVRQLRL